MYFAVGFKCRFLEFIKKINERHFLLADKQKCLKLLVKSRVRFLVISF